ncbi:MULTISPECIES: hypothetical protein [Bacteroides]|uniref:hypothetical protein n=1 Tax=Bacteroides TaxID=816 RepID=UPI002A81C88B|nr:hypothetical protein [Bacteroides nordii]
MKRIFVFAIGGTGSRVLRSFNMLLAAGIKGMDSELQIVPIIIDYDVVNGDKILVTDCLENYGCLHKKFAPGTQDDAFFMANISYLKDVATPGGNRGNDIESKNFDIYFAPENTTVSFAKSIGYNLMTGNNDLTHSLLEALYNDANEDDKETELNLNLTVGFKGNPNIGSVVLNKLKDTKEFKHFCNVFNATTDRVFIISSIFGGTGSSGFPQIVNAIRHSAMPGLVNAKIGTLVVLPYFKVQDDPDSAINSGTFNSKTKAALSFYEASNLNGLVDAMYYIGDDIVSQLENEEGGTSQKNNAHIVELIGALGLVDYCLKSDEELNKNAYEYGLKSDKRAEQECVDLSNFFEKESLEPHLRYLTCMAYAIKYYCDVIRGDRKKVGASEAYYVGLRLADKVGKSDMADFEKFIEYFKTWLFQMLNNEHAFGPYILDPYKYIDEDGVVFVYDDEDHKKGELGSVDLRHNIKLTKTLRNKQLEENKVLPDAITDGDFTKAMNNAYTKYKTSVTDANAEIYFMKILRDASFAIMNKVEKMK